MQVLFLPHWLTTLLCFVLWGAFQGGAGYVCYRLPVAVFEKDGWLYRTRSWEKGGRFWDDVFKVRRWKGFLPDGGAWFKNGYAKKHLRDRSAGNLAAFVAESRRAELTHWLAIAPFWVFGLFTPFFVVPVMLAYALAANLPCIIAQRYNRPRVQRLLEKERRKQ